MDEQALAGIEAAHHPDPVYGGEYCAACGLAYGRMPCDAALLLAEVRRYRAALENARLRISYAATMEAHHAGALLRALTDVDGLARAALAAEPT